MVLVKCLAVVPCATANEDSGSSLKLRSCVGQHYVLPGTSKTCFENLFFQMNPCIKICFPQIKSSLIIELLYALYSVYTPPWVWLDLLSTFVLTTFLIFTEEDPDFVPEDVE